MSGWTSPRLGVIFGLSGNDLALTGPDGRPLQDYVAVARARQQAEAIVERERARAEQAEARAERLAARLRELGLSENGT